MAVHFYLKLHKQIQTTIFSYIALSRNLLSIYRVLLAMLKEQTMESSQTRIYFSSLGVRIVQK